MVADPERQQKLLADLNAAAFDYNRNPQDESAIIWYGRRLAYLGRFEEAVAVYTRGLEVHPGSYRILRYWRDGPRRGTHEVVLDNLPGFPDNIDNGLNGRFWIGLVAPRNALLDRYATRPFLRRMIQRLPAFMRPRAASSSHVIAIDGDGEVLMNLQDPRARFPLLTGALELPDRLYLTTLEGPALPWIDKEDLR